MAHREDTGLDNLYFFFCEPSISLRDADLVSWGHMFKKDDERGSKEGGGVHVVRRS
jgi:hypothetical protein